MRRPQAERWGLQQRCPQHPSHSPCEAGATPATTSKQKCPSFSGAHTPQPHRLRDATVPPSMSASRIPSPAQADPGSWQHPHAGCVFIYFTLPRSCFCSLVCLNSCKESLQEQPPQPGLAAVSSRVKSAPACRGRFVCRAPCSVHRLMDASCPPFIPASSCKGCRSIPVAGDELAAG